MFLFRLLDETGTITAEVFTLPISGEPVSLPVDSVTLEDSVFTISMVTQEPAGMYTLIISQDGTPVKESLVFSDGSEGPFTEGNYNSPFYAPNPTADLYTTRASMERKYGKENIRIWADLDGDEDEDNVELVIQSAIYDASREVDAMVASGTYTVPFSVPIPPIIEQSTAYRAGALLYTARGRYTDSLDSVTTAQNKLILSWMEDIRRGRIALGVEQNKKVGTNAPFTSQ